VRRRRRIESPEAGRAGPSSDRGFPARPSAPSGARASRWGGARASGTVVPSAPASPPTAARCTTAPPTSPCSDPEGKEARAAGRRSGHPYLNSSADACRSYTCNVFHCKETSAATPLLLGEGGVTEQPQTQYYLQPCPGLAYTSLRLCDMG
jgi:hypothetical protein